MNIYQLGKIAAEESFGLAPLAGTAAKFIPVPFAGPLAAGITAGVEGEGKDTDEAITRALYAGGGNLLGSVGGGLAGALGGGALGGLAALPMALERKRTIPFIGKKKFHLDPEMLTMLSSALIPAGAAAGGFAGNLLGGYKGTQAGIRKHRESEKKREERAIEKYEGRKNKKGDE